MTKDPIHSHSEQISFQLLDGVFYTNVVETPNYTLATHERATDCYSNLVGNIRVKPDEVASYLDDLQQCFSKHNRTMTMYLTPFTQPANLQAALEPRGMQPIYKDAWMYFRGPSQSIALRPNVDIIKITTLETMRLFVDTFNQAYSGTDPREPYGQAPPEWGETLYAAFGSQKTGRTINYYMLCANQEPASVLLTSSIGRLAGIYSVGTVPRMRGQGHGAALTLYAVQQLLKQGTNEVFLQTEKDSYNEQFYTKLGFSTEWVAEAWSAP